MRRRVFNPDGPFVARRAFLFNGSRTVVGRPFPHTEVSRARLIQLFNLRMIDIGAEEPPAEEPPAELPWPQRDEKGILAYAHQLTGRRFRNVHNAAAAIVKEEANRGSTNGENS